MFALLYTDVNNLEKVDRMVSKNLPKPAPIKDSGKDLRIVDTRGIEYVLRNVDARDELFSQIIGFYPKEWQVVW
jgi:hypothetical protein